MNDNKKEESVKLMSILSFTFAIVGFFAFGFILGAAAIILGSLSFEKGLGKAGLFIGLVDVLGLLLIL